MRKVRMTVLLLVASLLLAPSVAFSAGTQDEETVEVAVAIHVDPGHMMFNVGERLKERLEDESDGRMRVTILGLEVGGERDHLEGVSAGEYDIALGGSVPMTLYAPKFAASDLPFVYSSTAEARQIYEGETGRLLNEQFVSNGNMRLVGLSLRNPRHLTSNFAVREPADVQGVKMRVPEIAPWVRVWREIGALPSPIAWPEVYTSLQTGVIEMQENPVDIIWNARIYEVQSHVNLTAHVYSFFHWLMSEDFYQSLSESDREMVLGVVEEVTDWGDEQTSAGAADLLEKIRTEGGMTVVEPDVAAFRAEAKPAIRELAREFVPEVRDYVLSFID